MKILDLRQAGGGGKITLRRVGVEMSLRSRPCRHWRALIKHERSFVAQAHTNSGIPGDQRSAPTDPQPTPLAQARPSDHQTTELLLLGSTSAFEEIHATYALRCRVIALRIVRDAQQAEEVVQDVFLALWSKPAMYDVSMGSLQTWLFAVTHHKSVDAVRSTVRRSGRDVSPSRLDSLLSTGLSPEEKAVQINRAARLRVAMQQLPDKQFQALSLAYLHGLSQTEIARLTGIPLGTVKTRSRAGLRALRMSLPDLHPVWADGL